MKQKFYRSLALLLFVLSTGAVIAQPGYHNDNNDKYYDNDRNRRGRDDDRNYRSDYRNYDERNRVEYKVRHRPSMPRYVQARRPSPAHVWIDGDWVYDRGAYRFIPGHWMMPNRGQTFVPGYWRKAHRGWHWVPGYWTRSGRW